MPPYFFCLKTVRILCYSLISKVSHVRDNTRMKSTFVKYNNNPLGKVVGDCVVRAISIAENKSWDDAYVDLSRKGYELADLPSSNSVWSEYLRDKGYSRHIISDKCPLCYTIDDFAYEYPVGTYVIGTGTHAVCIRNGQVIDAWDSRHETPIYYFEKER